MRYFEMSYVPKGGKALEIVSGILANKQIAREINQLSSGNYSLSKLTVKEKDRKKGEKRYTTKVRAHQKKLFGEKKIAAEFEIKLIAGKNYDTILISGNKEDTELGKMIFSYVQSKIMPKLNATDNVIVVRPFAR